MANEKKTECSFEIYRISRVVILILLLTLHYSSGTRQVVGQGAVPEAWLFDEFSTGIGDPGTFRADQKQIEAELKIRFSRYAIALRRAKAQPYAITYSPRVNSWEIYNRSIAEKRGGVLWMYLTPRGFDYRRITVVNGGFREGAATELWIVPPGAKPPDPKPTVRKEDVAFCPWVRVENEINLTASQDPLEFSAVVESNDPVVKPKLHWRVSDGDIVSGQGTNRIKVKTQEGAAGQVIARVDLLGYSLQCPADSTTAYGQMTFGVPHYNFTDFGKITCEYELALLDALTQTLRSKPELQTHIVVYGPRVGPRNVAMAQAARMKSYLINSRLVEPARIITVNGGYRTELSGELWLSPLGTGLPRLTPTIEEKHVKFTGAVRIIDRPCNCCE